MRTVSASVLCLWTLTGLSGCMYLTLNPETIALKKRQKEQMRQDRQTMESQKPIKVGEEIPVQFADVLLEGNWKGSACNQQMTIAIKMITRWDRGFNWRNTIQTEDVRGVFRATSQSQQANARIIETGLEGKFDLKAGFLTLTSTPRPPTEEESGLRAQEVAEIDRLKHKLIVFGWRGGPEEYHKMETRINSLVATHNQRVHEQIDAAKAALVSFKIDMARSMDGSGWAGIMEGADFDGCEIMVVSESGIRTDRLPPVTSQVALGRAQQHNYIKPSPLQVYWLDMASKDAKEEDFLDFGMYYERQGERSPKYYSQAANYYQIVVERQGDARAQGKLAHLYENGQGIPKNLDKAQQLYRLAGETRKKDLNVCTSSATKNFASRMMAQQHETTQGLGLAAGMLTGMQMQSGNSRVIAIEAVDVATMEKRFDCRFVSKRIDPKVNADLVPDGYYIEDSLGNIRYEDNAINKAAAVMSAGVLQKLAATMPFNNWVRVEPLGKFQYQLFWKDQFNKADEIVTVN